MPMIGKRMRTAVLILSALCATSGLFIARTPGVSAGSAATSPHRVVIFVAGLGASLTGTTGTGGCGGAWQTFETALARDGFACTDYLLYSY